MKSSSILAALSLVSLALILPSTADTFTLKDGTTLEGVILSETPDNYLMEVRISRSIKDQRTVAKADVVKISRELPDLKAYEAIAKLVPTPDLLTAAGYAANIAAVEKFTKAFPTSMKVKDADVLIATLKAESAQLAAGGVKFGGKFITPAEYKPNAYDLDARIQESKIRRLIDARQYIAALRLFGPFEAEFRNTKSFTNLKPSIINIIQSLVDEADENLKTLEDRRAQRKANVLTIPQADRANTITALNEETDAVEAAYNKEVANKEVWFTISPFHQASLEAMSTFGKSEIARLTTDVAAPGLDGGKIYQDFYNAVIAGPPPAPKEGEPAPAESPIKVALGAAKAAGIPGKYLAPLIEMANAQVPDK